jgi:preprotein translocase subunit YajC
MNLTLLQAAGAAEGGGMGYGNIILIVLMVVVFYFFMIRPQQKRQKEIRKFQESIQPGTDVVTSGGIHGKVKEVKDTYFVVEIAENTRVKVEKSSVFASLTDAQAK